MRDYQIVEYTPQHMKQVIDVISRVLRDQQVIPDSDEPIDDEDLYRIPELYTGRSRFWICVSSGTIIGTVALREMSTTTATLSRMFVLTAYHGQGIGQLLFDHAIQFARSQSYKKIVLNTHLLMKRAHRFYERNGLKRVAEDSEKYHYELDL